MNGESESPDTPPESAIAIVGMSGRFAGARNVEEFWRNLRDGVEAVSRPSDDELVAAGVDRGQLDDPRYVGATLELPDMEKFDAAFFGFAPRDAAIMDPQHRHFLECAWEALESAGHDPARFEGSIAVYAGSGHHAYFSRNLLSRPDLVDEVGFFLLRHTGNDKDFLATRVSYQFDLKGPSVNVQTACSTSLVAVHSACQSLLSGECDMALAGGVTIELPHRHGYIAREGEILSPDGHCRPFDAESNGTLFGSGVGVVLLRRLEDALEDRDPILAVIRGSAVNNDGAGKIGYLAPSVDGQAAAIAEAIEIADVDPSTIQYVEAHGTGTAVGDPIEVAALTQAFAGRAEAASCALGSVKSNIGHTDTAAGIASLVKVVQSIRHSEMPPTLNYSAPNPEIDFDATPFYVNAARREWVREDADVPRRAGVSSLGVGGTNAHVIVEEAPRVGSAVPSRSPQLIVLSARSGSALENAADRLGDALRGGHEGHFADVALTLQQGRRAFEVRRAFVAKNAAEAIAALDGRDESAPSAVTPKGRAQTVWMLPGGGSQSPAMGHALYQSEPVYRATVDRLLETLPSADGDELRGLLFLDSDDPIAEEDWNAAADALQRPSLQLPLIFITEFAMASLWRSWELLPGALIGHSMGENTAACIAGVLSAEEGLALVRLRGQLFERVAPGGMLSVAMDAEALESRLASDVCIASVNAPGLCVVSGTVDALEHLAEELEAEEVTTRRVQIDIAAHSPLLDPILEEWRSFLNSLNFSEPQIPFISNLTGTWITPEEATDPEYWVRHLRGTVRFAEGLRTLLEDDSHRFVEIGPGQALSSLAALQVGKERLARGSMGAPAALGEETSDAVTRVLESLGDLWCAGVEMNWPALHGADVRRRIPLPTYAFEHERHWIEPFELATANGGDPLRAEDVRDFFYAPAWRRAALDSSIDPSGAVLILDDGSRLTEALTHAYQENGVSVTSVSIGKRFEQTSDGSYRVRASVAADFERLFQDLAARECMPRVIAHFWNCSAARDGSDISQAEYVAGRDRGFGSLLAFCQAVGAQATTEPMRIIYFTRALQSIAGEPVRDPLRALGVGACGVLSREFPNLECRSVDFDLDVDLSETLDARTTQEATELLRRELAQADDAREVALRRSRRFVQTGEPVSIEAAGKAPATESDADRAPDRGLAIRDEGVYLITGGLGGLGLHLAKHLGGKRRAKLILLGRGSLPDRGLWSDWLETRPVEDRTRRQISALLEIEELGGEALYVSTDVCDRERLEAAIGDGVAQFGELDGVFHTAGVLDDGLAQLKTLEEAERVLGPKVRGTLALASVLADLPGDSRTRFLALYSSVSARAGLPGQVDYAAASAFLNTFSRTPSFTPGWRVLSLGWGPWREIGMAAELAGASAHAKGEAAPIPLAHPLLENIEAETAKGECYSTLFSTEKHWLVDEHRLATGEALIPGTGFLELAAAALESRPEDRAIELRDVFLEAPFIVADDEERRLELRLDRSSGDFLVLGAAAGSDGLIEQARGSVSYVDRAPSPAVEFAALRDRCSRREERFDGPPSGQHLRFGPRWGCLEHVGFGEDEAIAELRMPSDFASELDVLRFHPALLDMATGCAHGLLPGFDASSEFCVPMSYSKIVSQGSIPERVFAHLRLKSGRDESGEFGVFDVILFDEAGDERLRFEDFVVKRIRGVEGLVDAEAAAAVGGMSDGEFGETDGDAEEQATLLADLRDAITPAEGIDALERILASAWDEQLWILPHPMQAWLKSLADRSAPAVEMRKAELAPELVAELDAVATTLCEHEAIADATLTAHFDRPGQTRRLAHIVWKEGEQATVSELRRFVRAHVPDDQLPQNFVDVGSIPRLANGQPDRDSLDDPYGLADDYVAPRTEVEATLSKIWCETMGIDRIGVHDNFFDIGGHSLLAIRAIMRTEKALGVRLNNAIMVLQTLEQVAAECERRNPDLAAPSQAIEEPEGSDTADSAPARGDSSPVRRGLGSRVLGVLRGLGDGESGKSSGSGDSR